MSHKYNGLKETERPSMFVFGSKHKVDDWYWQDRDGIKDIELRASNWHRIQEPE